MYPRKGSGWAAKTPDLSVFLIWGRFLTARTVARSVRIEPCAHHRAASASAPCTEDRRHAGSRPRDPRPAGTRRPARDPPLRLTIPPLQNLAFLMNGQISEFSSRAHQPLLNAGQTVGEPPGFQVIRNLILEVLDVLRSTYVIQTRESIRHKVDHEFIELFLCFDNKAGESASKPLPYSRAVPFCQFDPVFQLHFFIPPLWLNQIVPSVAAIPAISTQEQLARAPDVLAWSESVGIRSRCADAVSTNRLI